MDELEIPNSVLEQLVLSSSNNGELSMSALDQKLSQYRDNALKMKGLTTDINTATTQYEHDYPDTVMERVSAMGTGVKNLGQGLANIVQHPVDSATKAFDAVTQNPKILGSIALRGLGGVAGGTLGALGGPASAATVPAGIGIGSNLGGDLAQLFGLEKEDTPRQELEGLGADVLLSGAPIVAGQVASTGRDLMRKAVPSRSIQNGLIASEPGAAGNALGFPGRRTGTERQMFDELTRGEEQFVKANPVEGIRPNPQDPFAGFNEFKDRLNQSIKDAQVTRDNLVSQLDSAALEAKLPGIGFEDIDLTPLQAKNSGASSFAAGDVAATNNAISLLRKNFENTTKDFDGVLGNPDHWSSGIVPSTTKPVRLSLAETKNVLDDVYNQLEELQAFDASAKAKGIESPSILAENAAKVDALRGVASSLKRAMDTHASKIANELGLDPAAAEIIRQSNEMMHGLIPYRGAAERFGQETAEGLTTRSPASLVQTDLTVPNSPTGVVATIANKLGGEGRRVGQVLARPDEAVRKLQEMVAFRSGEPIPLPRNFNALINSPQARSTVAVLAAQAGLIQDPTIFDQIPTPAQKQIAQQVSMMNSNSFERAPSGFSSYWQGRLYDQFEISMARKEIQESQLSTTEKALRISKLNLDGTFEALPDGSMSVEPDFRPTQAPSISQVSNLASRITAPQVGSSDLDMMLGKMRQMSY